MLSVKSSVVKSPVINQPAFKGCPVGSREFVKCLAKEELGKAMATTPTAKVIASYLVETATKFKGKMYNLIHRKSALRNLDKAKELAKRNPKTYSIISMDTFYKPHRTDYTNIIRNCNNKVDDFGVRITHFDKYGKLEGVSRQLNDCVNINHDLKGNYYIWKPNPVHPEREIETRIHFKNFKEMLSYFRENLPKLKNNKDI